MSQFLDNPVYFALVTGDSHFASGTENVKYFPKEVSPFAGFPEEYENGFAELHKMLPEKRRILYATRKEIPAPNGWKLFAQISGAQFVFHKKDIQAPNAELPIVPLTTADVDQMIELARLTKPGPFDKRTIEFGSYYGIVDGQQLVAMTGQRLHIYDHAEISAVCTRPGYNGRGYASALVQHQLQIILNENKTPFLHVRADNAIAIGVYERLGFEYNGVMNFYFMEKMDSQ